MEPCFISGFNLQGVIMSLRDAHYTRLAEQAEQGTGRAGVLYYLFACGDRERLENQVAFISSEDREAQLTWRLISQTESPRTLGQLLDDMQDSFNPWLIYSLAKRLIFHGCIRETLLLAKGCLQRDGYDVRILNLLARSLFGRGDYRLAQEIAERSLARNPFQEDLVVLKQQIEKGLPYSGELYLELRPKPCTIAFYLPVYNVEAFVRTALEGILHQYHPIDALIVVNDGTTDDSMSIVRAYPVTVVAHAENRGLAAARNTAFRHTACDWVASVDTDACPDPDWLRYAVMTLEHAPSTLAGLGGMLVEQFTDTIPDAWRAAHLAQHWGTARQSPSPLLFGANTLLRREAVMAVGGYDERFRTNAEDANMDYRLRAQGYELAYEPAMKAYHRRRDTVASLMHTRWNYEFWYRETHGYFDGIPAVVTRLPEMLDAAMLLFAEDERLLRPHFRYLDVLCFFYDAIRAAHYAVQQQRCSASEGGLLQHHVLNLIPEGYQACFRRDLAGFLLAETGEAGILTGWPDVLAAIEPKLAFVFSVLNPDDAAIADPAR